MGRTKIVFDEQLVRDVCSTSSSMSEAARRLGVRLSTLKRIALELGCYNPSRHSRPEGYVPRRITKKDLELYYFSNVRHITAARLRWVLIREGVKDARCELCNAVQWLGKPIPLELHHKDGDHYNNAIDNLMIVCPTCHAWLTDNSNLSVKSNSRYVGTAAEPLPILEQPIERKKDKKAKLKSIHKEPTKYERTCPTCGKAYKTDNSDQRHCSYTCAGKSCRKFDLSGDDLLSMFREEANYTKIAARLGVSGNAVKKRCKTLGIYDEVKELVDAEKRRRAIENQRSQTVAHRRLAASKSRDIINRKMDYYVAYTIVDGSAVELARFESTKQLKDAGYSAEVVRRVCLGQARTYKGWLWRREPKV